MRFSGQYIKGEEDSQVFVVLGNGVREEKVLRYLAPKFNGSKYILSYTPSPLSIKPEKRTGISAIENLVRILMVGGFKVKQALFLVDREHVSSLDFVANEIQRKYSFNVEKVKILRENVAGIFRLSREGLVIEKFYVVIAGKTKGMEEELKSLIQGVHGGRFKLKDALVRSTLEQIAKTLPGLYLALKSIEQAN
ncbi:MAG: hypothetical protein ACTSV7_10135 [Candidatus Baldrarchaeia archaeon]